MNYALIDRLAITNGTKLAVAFLLGRNIKEKLYASPKRGRSLVLGQDYHLKKQITL